MSEPTNESLIVTCPTCEAELEIPAATFAEFELGDVLVCDACDSQLEVVSLEPPEFELLADFAECPNCNNELEISEEMLEDGVVTCPSCGSKFDLESETDGGAFN